MAYGQKTTPAVLRYHKVLNNISEAVTCSIVEYGFSEELEVDNIEDIVAAGEKYLMDQLSTCKSSRIVILASCETLISSLFYDKITSRFNYAFVDDYQSLIDGLVYDGHLEQIYRSNILSDGLLLLVENSSTNNTSFWVFCDNAQSVFIGLLDLHPRFEFCRQLDEFRNMFESQKVLSVNLRNTHEISSVLSVIRKHYNTVQFYGAGTLGLNQQNIGHFLRGTKPTIYLLRHDNPASCIGILEKELLKVRRTDSNLDGKDIAILYDGEKYGAELLYIMNSLQGISNKEIAMHLTSDCISAEWPAVVYLHRLTSRKIRCAQTDGSVKKITFSNTIPFLYNALSRARVYSTAIIYNYTPNICKYTDNMLSELRERRDICRIVD